MFFSYRFRGKNTSTMRLGIRLNNKAMNNKEFARKYVRKRFGNRIFDKEPISYNELLDIIVDIHSPTNEFIEKISLSFFNNCMHVHKYITNDTEFNWQDCKDCDLCEVELKNRPLGNGVNSVIRDICFHVWHNDILINYCTVCGHQFTDDQRVSHKKCFNCGYRFI